MQTWHYAVGLVILLVPLSIPVILLLAVLGYRIPMSKDTKKELNRAKKYIKQKYKELK